MPDAASVRAHFPALAGGFAFLDNAGGSQLPHSVIDAMTDYLRHSYAQLGASYPASVRAKQVVDGAHALLAEFVNAGPTGGIVLAASSTALVHLLANAYSEILQPGDEVIVAETNHEGDATPWYRLERCGVKVVNWPLDPETLDCPLATLQGLLNARTRVVAFPHVSNLTGQIAPVREICDLVRQAGAVSVCDGVAYAPHRAIDVQDYGCDFYFYSAYKVFGPHLGVLFGRHAAFAPLTGPNHVFIPRTSFPGKWEPGGVNHEGCAGILGLRPYFETLAGEPWAGHGTVRRAYAAIEALEQAPHARLHAWFAGRSDLRLIGPAHFEPARSVGIVSFCHKRRKAVEIAEAINARGFGMKHGHFYSFRLVRALGLDPEDGVARISLAHYNTVEEIDRLTAALMEVLAD
ncbi:MAG: aminotransferase class V-fold PLP-dependent enzyme [Verrucomicrobia bacterium]|nr:aminotransferase class V-fold PLP-dependent enzyme [Verrucomicrobiota bacterium]